MFTLIARFLLRNRLLALGLILVPTALILTQADQLRFSHQFSRLLPDTDSTQIDYNHFRNVFDQVGNSVIIAADSFDVFEEGHYQFWRKLEKTLNRSEGVAGVVSPTSSFYLSRNDSLKKLEYHRLHNMGISSADSLGELYWQMPFYDQLLYDGQRQVPLMIVRIARDQLYTKNITPIVQQIHQHVKEAEQRSGVDLKISGLPFLRTSNTVQVGKEIGMFIGLAVAITSLILYLFLKSFRAMAISMVVVFTGVAWTFGLLGYFGFPISLLSSLIPTLMIVIGVPNCIFLINKYHAEYKGHKNKVLALQRVVRKVGVATLLTNATTAMGFAALIFVDSKVLKEFGIIASLNILILFLISLVIIPVYYSYAKAPKERHYSHFEKRWLTRFIHFLIDVVRDHRNKVYWAFGVLTALALWGITQMYATGNLSEEYKKSDPVYKDIQFLEEKFNGSVPLEIMVDTRRRNGALKQSTLKRLDKLQDSLHTQPELSRPISVVEGLKFARQAYFRGNPDFYDLPTSQERNFIASYIPNDKSARQGLIGSLTDSTNRYARVTMRVQDMGGAESKALKANVNAFIEQIFDPERYEVTVTGAWIVFLKGTEYLIKNLLLSLTLAIVVIAFIMALIFRSFRMVVVALVPNLFPLIMTAGIMGFFGVPLKPSTILVFSVAFGISVDDTIHFLAKYRQELKLSNFQIRRAVFLAIRETGVSMFYTSVVLFFGFSTFLASSFGGIVALGLLVSITLVIAMFSNLILLPTLLLSFERLSRIRSFTKEYSTPYDQVREE